MAEPGGVDVPNTQTPAQTSSQGASGAPDASPAGSQSQEGAGASTSARGTSFYWDEATTTALLEGLVEQIDAGKRADNSFKKEAWTAALACVAPHCRVRDGVRRLPTQQQATNRLSYLREDWIEWRRLKEQTGIGWDEERNIPIAPDEWWDTYLRVR
jgi:hypothetical protein